MRNAGKQRSTHTSCGAMGEGTNYCSCGGNADGEFVAEQERNANGRDRSVRMWQAMGIL